MRDDASIDSISRSRSAPTLVTDRANQRSSMTKLVVVGTVLGLAWGASLRAWMALLALKFGDHPQFTWQGTFGAVLVPVALMGAVLGSAVYVAETSGTRWWRWTILVPLLLILFPAIVVDDFIATLTTSGLGGGAIGVALIGLVGGYAFSGFGARWIRWVCGLLAALMILATVYGIYFSDPVAVDKFSASDAFSVLSFLLLMALLIAGVSLPGRSRHISS